MSFRFLFLVILAAVFALTGDVVAAAATEGHSVPADEHAGGHDEHHTLPLKPPVLFNIGGFTVTNSMLVTWVVAALIIIFAQAATRKIKAVPTGAQNFWEWLVESLYAFLQNVIGAHLVKTTFWFFATTFIFILFLNWFGLLPGVGSIGWGHSNPDTGSFIVDRPLLRGANADLNLTLAMACVFFVLWIVWAIQMNGVGGVLVHIFGPKGGKMAGALGFLMVVIFFVVGILEIVSILFRPISLSFRLYGNIYAGEVMLESMAAAGGKWLAWLVPIPFYFLELLVGLVQALVFMLLTGVFTLLIAPHDSGHGEAHH